MIKNPDYCIQLTDEQMKKFDSGIPIQLTEEQKGKMNRTFDELEETEGHYSEWLAVNTKRFLRGQSYITLEEFYEMNNYFKKGDD